MTNRELDSLLQHLRDKLSKFVGCPDASFQVEIHAKGDSVQFRVTEIGSLQRGKTPLEERR